MPAGLIHNQSCMGVRGTTPDISSSWSVMAAEAQNGRTRAAPFSSFGQAAPKILPSGCARRARERVPRLAHRHRCFTVLEPDIYLRARGLAPRDVLHEGWEFL